ncbi:hypothetical protein HNP55_002557 [Paucibacter oligotrophus]|uniref:Uncharacterized protein n=1 Tax=Roseateles oligotrophus TaxID=1769250 RepID=A0A840L8C9_9BURK|nr:hypothetical protein [Roseateles oligotrophus]MBB4844021.1 hypothetical protein [Roseateles oligotrophus]
MTRKLLSAAISLHILARPALGRGTDPGSVKGSLWTPGRDAQGAVNEVSWAAVPTGQWLNVADTRLDALDAVVKAAIPGWSDPGSQKWDGVTNAWNGVAMDTEGCRAWWVCAGGHADSANNGIYRFDALRMAYAVECLPSDTGPWKTPFAAYGKAQSLYQRIASGGSVGPCLESEARYQADLAADIKPPEGGWFGDELVWDRKPIARHVYSGTVYLPASNELVLARGRLWRYSLAAGRWTYRRHAKDSASRGFGEASIAYQDPANGQLIVGSCGSDGPFGATFDFKTESWTGYMPPWASWDWDGAADTCFNEELTLLRPPSNPDVGSGSRGFPGRYMRYKLRTRQASEGVLQFEAGLSQSDFANQSSFYDGAGLVYIPPLNRYWLSTQMKDGRLAWFELDPSTTPWTLRRMPQATGDWPAPSAGSIVKRRMMWLPSLSALVYLGSASKNISIYKV